MLKKDIGLWKVDRNENYFTKVFKSLTTQSIGTVRKDVWLAKFWLYFLRNFRVFTVRRVASKEKQPRLASSLVLRVFFFIFLKTFLTIMVFSPLFAGPGSRRGFAVPAGNERGNPGHGHKWDCSRGRTLADVRAGRWAFGAEPFEAQSVRILLCLFSTAVMWLFLPPWCKLFKFLHEWASTTCIW